MSFFIHTRNKIGIHSLLLMTSLLIACAISAPLRAQRNPCPALKEGVIDKKFTPGQVWSYESRPGESASTLTILRVDSGDKTGVVIHVGVDGLKMHNPRGDLVPSIGHMPFKRDAMLGSVTNLIKSNQPLPSFEGVDYWKEHCGGVYTISVRDAVDVAEKTLNSK